MTGALDTRFSIAGNAPPPRGWNTENIKTIGGLGYSIVIIKKHFKNVTNLMYTLLTFFLNTKNPAICQHKPNRRMKK